MPQNPNKKSLGLGLGLGANARGGFRRAVEGGTLTDFLGQHQRANRRFGRDLAGGLPGGGNRLAPQGRQTTAQGMQDKNAAAGGNAGAPPGAATGPPGGAGQKPAGAGGQPGATGPPGGAGQKPGAPGASGPPAAPAAAAGGQGRSAGGAGGTVSSGAAGTATPAAGGFQGFLNNTFGAGNPFNTRPNFSDPSNPVFAGAKRALDQQLAATRARFAAGGTGQSDREALAEGNALGDFGAQVAQLGEQSYQSDAQRALQAALGGQQNLMNLNNALTGVGTGLTAIGAQEQQLPGMAGIMSLLNALSGGTNTANTSSKSSIYG